MLNSPARHAFTLCLVLISMHGAVAVRADSGRPLTARAEAADPRADEARAPTPADRTGWRAAWYGWQGLLADAASVGILFGLEGTAKLFGVLTLLAGTPVVHAVHGNGTSCLVSAVVRVASVALIVA